jgi:cytochrome c oxidase subunit 2
MSPGTITGWLRTMLFLPAEASTVAQSIDHLHMLVIIITMLGSAAVGLMSVYFVVRYHHRGEDLTQARPPATQTQTPPRVEWALALGLFALFFAFWIIGFLQYVRVRVAPEDTYDVYVTAKQWMWKFAYADGNHSIARLYVPAGRPVKLIMTSRDVIHSFFVPDFRLKQDVLPGRYTTLWFTVPTPGTHQVLCAEYCGTSHSTMRAEVIALDGADFARWLAAGPRDVESAPPVREIPAVSTELGPSRVQSLVRLGELVAAQQGCLRCHTLDGAPHIGPTWAGLYRASIPLAEGGTVVADEAYLTESMMDPLARRHAGYATVMPSYLGRLRPAEVAALLALIKSLRDVRGQAATGPATAPPAAGPPSATLPPPPAGALGQPAQPSLPLLQPVPASPAAPAPASQGLPPPGAPVLPPLRGAVEIGPEGPRVPAERP